MSRSVCFVLFIFVDNYKLRCLIITLQMYSFFDGGRGEK